MDGSFTDNTTQKQRTYINAQSSIRTIDLSVQELINRISKKYNVKVRTGFIWLRIRNSGGLVFHKMPGFSLVTEHLFVKLVT
jgi:hypothetical protein